jgi:hypothetical protein
MTQNYTEFDGPTLLISQPKESNPNNKESGHIIYTSPITSNTKYETIHITSREPKSAHSNWHGFDSKDSALRRSIEPCPYSRSAPSLIGVNTSSLPVTPRNKHSPLNSPNDINSLMGQDFEVHLSVRKTTSIQLLATERNPLTESTDLGVEISPVPGIFDKNILLRLNLIETF